MKLRNKIFQLIFCILFFLSGNSIAQTLNGEVVNNPAAEQEKTGQKKDGLSLSKIIDSVISNKKEPSSSTSTKDSSSIMYSTEESLKIKEAFDAFKNDTPFAANAGSETPEVTAPKEDNAKSYIYLGSILYRSQNNWTVWINDKKISHEDNKPTNELYIKSIDNEKANIVWTMSISKWRILTGKKSEDEAPLNANNQVEFNFTLSFNQTYILSANKIVEGRIFPSTIIKEEGSGMGNLINQIFK